MELWRTRDNGTSRVISICFPDMFGICANLHGNLLLDRNMSEKQVKMTRDDGKLNNDLALKWFIKSSSSTVAVWLMFQKQAIFILKCFLLKLMSTLNQNSPSMHILYSLACYFELSKRFSKNVRLKYFKKENKLI